MGTPEDEYLISIWKLECSHGASDNDEFARARYLEIMIGNKHSVLTVCAK
jgi:hypothetical protein